MDFNTADNSAKYNELLGQVCMHITCIPHTEEVSINNPPLTVLSDRRKPEQYAENVRVFLSTISEHFRNAQAMSARLGERETTRIPHFGCGYFECGHGALGPWQIGHFLSIETVLEDEG
jgi:hypothetical protein